MSEKLITPEEAAKELGVSVQTVRNFVKKGTVKFIKVGGRYRIYEQSVMDILNPHNAQSNTELES